MSDQDRSPLDAITAYQRQLDCRRELAIYFAERGDPRTWAPLFGLMGEALEGIYVEFDLWQRDPVGYETPLVPVFVNPADGTLH